MVTRSLSSDLKPFNITVISVHPGNIVKTIQAVYYFYIFVFIKDG